jgi:hypothetical protein
MGDGNVRNNGLGYVPMFAGDRISALRKSRPVRRRHRVESLTFRPESLTAYWRYFMVIHPLALG